MRAGSDWFAVERSDSGITRLGEPSVDALIRANLWLIEGTRLDVVIDTGNGLAPLSPTLARIRGQPDKPLLALATHGHMDHAGGLHEFEQRAGHALDAPEIRHIHPLLWGDDVWPGVARQSEEAGYPVPALLIDRPPRTGFDPARWRPVGTTLTRTVGEGDVLDLGDRSLSVLHLPGHTPGSIGLLDEERAMLFSGDAVYAEEPIIDTAPTSDVGDYVRTMERLLHLRVEVVHPGHDESFGGDLLSTICDRYLMRHGGIAQTD
jgi:glyoxylase-like metal-dependent hydrolase (beta-lactamase superfamily II)